MKGWTICATTQKTTVGEYEVDDKDIVKALIDMTSGWTASAKKSVIEILDNILDGSQRKDILAELEVSSYEEAYEKAKKELNISSVKEVEDKKFIVYKILDYILGDISHYAEVKEDELKEYFRDEAEEDFDDYN